MKRPAFQFYPADWRKDAALQSCSIAAQGLWINILCIAHECEPYGHMTVNGKAMTPAQIGRLVGLSAKECEKLLGELLEAGVSSVREDGGIFSRRMVRDEDLRNRRSDGGGAGAEHGAKGGKHGSKGGRPTKARGVSEPPLPPAEEPPLETDPHPPIKPPPSSSSSSSTSVIPTSVGIAGADAGAGASPGEACKAMREAGMAEVSPSSPRLLALLSAGITTPELADAARHAVSLGKSFAYALGVAEGRRRDAAIAPLPAAVGVPRVSGRHAAAAAAIYDMDPTGVIDA